MTAYGILLVDTSWSNYDSAKIDKTTHLRHNDLLIAGTKALIYVREPLDAIVAEADVTGTIVEREKEPSDPAFDPAIPAICICARRPMRSRPIRQTSSASIRRWGKITRCRSK